MCYLTITQEAKKSRLFSFDNKKWRDFLVKIRKVHELSLIHISIRLRMKDLSDGRKSLYLDIYRNGKRTYEYLKLYLIPGTDSNTRRQNEITMAAAKDVYKRQS